MKIKTLYFFSLIMLLFGCKEREPKTRSTSLETPVLRKATVTGAKQVTIDQQNKIIQIILPETFTADKIRLDLDLVDGVSLGTEGPFFAFNFKGSAPMVMHVRNNYTDALFPYKIFVDLEGNMEANLASDLTVSPNGSCLANIKFTRGVGTIPERPNENSKMLAYLHNPTEPNSTIEGSGDLIFKFEDAFKLLSADHVGLKIEYADQKFVLPGKLSLKRFPMEASFDKLSTWWNLMPKNAEVKIKGGCFLKGKKYSVRLGNEPVEAALSVPAAYEDLQHLKFTVPASLSDGNYFVSVYEDDLKISDAIYTISNKDDQKGIQQIWKDYNPKVTFIALLSGEPTPIIANAGKELYVNPYPMLIGFYKGAEVPLEKLPTLKISGNGVMYELVPKKMIDDSFGDNALVLYYGAYTIPADIKPGNYKMHLKYKDWGETTPFCKLLEIK